MIRLATADEAPLVHKTMITAFEEYRHLDVPSGALDETVESIKEALKNGSEKALLYFRDGVSVGSVRFKTGNNSLYFFRLSVIPEARRQGIAKSMLSWLEDYAKEHGFFEISCAVRASIPKNVRLYQSVGYNIIEEKAVTNSKGISINILIMKKEIL